MKVKDIESALGIGTLFNEEDCSFMESKYIDSLMNNLEYMIYFHSVQSENYASTMRKRKYTFLFINEGGMMRFYELYKIKEETTVKDAVRRNLIPWKEYKEKIDENFDKNSQGSFFVLEKNINCRINCRNINEIN